jgi:hypothetical protein
MQVFLSFFILASPSSFNAMLRAFGIAVCIICVNRAVMLFSLLRACTQHCQSYILIWVFFQVVLLRWPAGLQLGRSCT